MKQTFVVEIDCPRDCQSLTSETVKESVRGILWGEYGRRKALAMQIQVKKITVEQNCGTPESIDKNALDLLKRAVKTLDNYERGDKIDSLDDLAWEIDNYIEDNTRER